MATQTLTLSSPETSPELHALRSPSIPWSPRSSQSPADSRSPSTFRLPASSPQPNPHPPLSSPSRSPDPHLLNEQDIVASPLIPADHKPTILDCYHQLRFILTTHDRRGTGFEASGARPADRLVAAEQSARMTMVFEWYVDFFEKKKKKRASVVAGYEDHMGDECESMATELLDAGLCASGWQGTWDQAVFVTPLCLIGREDEVAELAAWSLKYFERPSVPSADRILGFWEGPPKPAQEPIRSATKPHVRDLKAEIEWLDLQRPGRGRFRAHNDIFHAADMCSAERDDLDHEVWKMAAEGAGRPKESLEVGWPPEESLEGYCLMDKLVQKEHRMYLEQRQWVYDTVSRYLRPALHPWCLRCYRTRCRSRDASIWAWIGGVLDMLFMLFGILIMLVVEWYIAWTDERVPTDAPFAERIRRTWSLCFESEVQDGIDCWHVEDSPVTRCRHRSVSCPF